MQLSARNQLKGSITAISRGAVNGDVTLTLPGGQAITAIITLGSCDRLELDRGKPAIAIFKASSVMLGVE